LIYNEKLGNPRGAAMTYAQLGVIAALQNRYEKAGRLLVKAIFAFVASNDSDGLRGVVNNFLVFHERAGTHAKSKLKLIWNEAGLGPFPGAQ
jgi:hypothetical protein